MSNAPILEATALNKVFRVRRNGAIHDIHALKNVDTRLFPGETLGLVGESGSGKTTLARILIGIEEQTSGEVMFEGNVVQNAESWQALRREVQYVFQDPFTALCPTMRIGAALAEPLAIHDICPKPERKDRVDKMLGLVGLGADMAGRLPYQLSGGQRQRVNLARALMLEPRVLICDEIVSGLDVSVQAQVLALLVDLQEQLGLSLIFISHDLRVVRYLCDRVQVMLLGDTVEHGPTEDVFDNPQHEYTRKLLDAIPDRDRVAHRSNSALQSD